MLPAELELTEEEKARIRTGIEHKQWAEAKDASIFTMNGCLLVEFPLHTHCRDAKKLHGTYEQIVQYLLDMYPRFEPDCPRIIKESEGHWHNYAVRFHVYRHPYYQGSDINRIAAILKEHKKVYVENDTVRGSIKSMFPFTERDGLLVILPNAAKKNRGANTRRANRVKKGLVGWWGVRLLYDEFLNALNERLYRRDRAADVQSYRWPGTAEAYAERTMKLAVFCDRSGIKPRRFRLNALKPYIPGLLKRPEPLWRKYGRWLKKRTQKCR